MLTLLLHTGCASGGGPPEIVTGSDDGTVRVWDTRQADKPVVDMVVEEGETPRACWAVNFGEADQKDVCTLDIDFST